MSERLSHAEPGARRGLAGRGRDRRAGRSCGTAAGCELAIAAASAAARPAARRLRGRARATGSWSARLSPRNAAALRSRLEWLRPRPLGTQTSAGLGDRLGLATPGHVAAMSRGRPRNRADLSPTIDPRNDSDGPHAERGDGRCSLLGVFAAGWRGRIGADADHLKTQVRRGSHASAGFTFFTIDPSAHVDSAADTDDLATLRAKVAALPWAELEDSRGGAAQALRRARASRSST